MEEKYSQTAMFLELLEDEEKRKQFPVKCPHSIKRIFGFGELLASIHYLKLGSNVVRYYYYRIPGYDSYEEAIRVLGREAAKLVCQPHPQPPDLFVFDKKGRFFFVEGKLPRDRLQLTQKVFFPKIERYLNRNMPKTKRAPHMPTGHWIEILSLTTQPDESQRHGSGCGSSQLDDSERI